MCSVVVITVSSLHDTLITQYHCLQKALHCLTIRDLDLDLGLDTKIGLNIKLDWIQNWIGYKTWIENTRFGLKMSDLQHLEVLMAMETGTSSLSKA